MLELKNLKITLTRSGRALIEGFDLVLAPGDKAVVIGEEGNGKSTLLGLIWGELRERADIIAAYMPQDYAENRTSFLIGRKLPAAHKAATGKRGRRG
jgi:ABC-type hemin transport system ATPase subunit